jgi:hypothetical protein
MNQNSLQRKTLKPVRIISVKGTLNLLDVDQETFILFSDAKPSTIRTTADRLKGKKFIISEAGLIDRTKITRII